MLSLYGHCCNVSKISIIKADVILPELKKIKSGLYYIVSPLIIGTETERGVD